MTLLKVTPLVLYINHDSEVKSLIKAKSTRDIRGGEGENERRRVKYSNFSDTTDCMCRSGDYEWV